MITQLLFLHCPEPGIAFGNGAQDGLLSGEVASCAIGRLVNSNLWLRENQVLEPFGFILESLGFSGNMRAPASLHAVPDKVALHKLAVGSSSSGS